jgi:HPr kinase/phosphorylase
LGLQPVQNIHASCVCHAGQGLLILGASGAGKSSLAMQMLALGAHLVADDRCDLSVIDGRLHASAPAPLAGMIEARGIGLLRLPYVPFAPLVAAVDLSDPLDNATLARMPPPRSLTLAGVEIDFLYFQAKAHFPSILMCYLISKATL